MFRDAASFKNGKDVKMMSDEPEESIVLGFFAYSTELQKAVQHGQGTLHIVLIATLYIFTVFDYIPALLGTKNLG